MGVLLFFVPLFAFIVFRMSFELGILEAGLLVAGLIAVPFAADKIIPDNGRNELNERAKAAGMPWLFPALYVALAIALYYALYPHIVARQKYVPITDELSMFLQVASVALVVAMPVYFVLDVILDLCGVWKFVIDRLDGGTPPPRAKRPISSASVETKEPDLGGFDPARFKRDAPPPPKPMTIKRETDSVVRGVDFARGKPDRTLH